MSRPVLKLGSSGNSVKELAKLLIAKLPDCELEPDDKAFDLTFESEVVRFQKLFHLDPDGVVGKNSWNALLGTEAFVRYQETIPLQDHTEMHCWKFATWFLLQGKGGPASPLFVTAGPAKTEANLIGFGGLENSEANMRLFANHWHLTMLQQPVVTASSLAEMLRIHGRVMLNAKSSKDYSSHLVTVVGIRGDGTAGGSTVAIMDPIQDVDHQPTCHSFAKWLYKNPNMYYQMLFR